MGELLRYASSNSGRYSVWQYPPTKWGPPGYLWVKKADIGRDKVNYG